MTRRATFWILVVFVVTACQGTIPPPPVIAVATPLPSGVLLEQSGAGVTQTATFDAPETWALDYSYDCGNAVVTQVLVQAKSPDGWEQLLGNGGQRSASGTTYGHHAGATYIDVSISCAWTIRVRGV